MVATYRGASIDHVDCISVLPLGSSGALAYTQERQTKMTLLWHLACAVLILLLVISHGILAKILVGVIVLLITLFLCRYDMLFFDEVDDD